MPEFACRWCVKGITPDFWNSTTIFDLSVDRRTITVYPGGSDRHTVLLDRTLVTRLHEFLVDDAPVMVTGLRIDGYRRQLGFRPYQLPIAPTGPVEMFVHVPTKADVQVIYHKESLIALRETFAEMADAISD
jgi:hypothetical protein